MKNTLFIFLLLFSIFLIGCSSKSEDVSIENLNLADTNYSTHLIDDQFSIDLPTYMDSTSDLMRGASVQFNNLFKEKHIVVLSELNSEASEYIEDFGSVTRSKSRLENYADARLKAFVSSGITIKEQSKLVSKLINGRKSFSMEIDARVQSLAQGVTYFFTFIEGKNHIYLIKSWTLSIRKGAYADEVETMVQSFKEL